MTKKMISFIFKEIIIFVVLVLCTILFLNISTLLSIKKIENGDVVKTGFASAIVNSGSMEPALSKHDLIVVKAKSEYVEGDIVTFVANNGSFITHRVINVSESGLITQGDANNTPDSGINQQRILGEVILVVSSIGLIANLLSMPIGIVCIIAFPVCILIITHLIRKIREEKGMVT